MQSKLKLEKYLSVVIEEIEERAEYEDCPAVKLLREIHLEISKENEAKLKKEMQRYT